MKKPHQERFAWVLDWNLLRTFMVIVEERSITRAANRLGLKQPTVSNALRRMEERLQQLMARRNDQLVPCTSYRNWFDNYRRIVRNVYGPLSDPEGWPDWSLLS